MLDIVQEAAARGKRSARLTPRGDLDAAGATVVRRAVAAEVAAGRTDLTVNLDRVGSLDSAGLGSLISALRIARDAGGDVRLETSNPRIRRILEVTALSKVFKLAAVSEAA